MENPFIQKDFNKTAEKLKQGDQKAGEEIFNYFQPKIFRYFMVRLGNRDTAEDLSQDIFLKLIGKIDSFNADLGNFSAWFWQIARNSLIDYYRQKKTTAFANLDAVSPYLVDEKQNRAPEKSRLEAVMKLVSELNEEEQEIFSLRHLSGLSYKELSRMTGKSEGSLRVSLHRINQKIRKEIHD
ncbi:MAG: RNA polymerase sigma factor [Patescibacteria group bacterium]